MRRIVIRFENRQVHSFTPIPGEPLEAQLLSHLAFFPGKKVVAVEEQGYTPEHPKAFTYRPRDDLLALAQGAEPAQKE